MEFGKRLKRLRERQSLTAKEVATKIGVSVSTYRDWETGRKIMGEPYEKIARALNVSLYELMTGKAGNPTEFLQNITEIEKICQEMRTQLGPLLSERGIGF